ncbi:MAG: excinuclease ABC subunit UvrC [Acidobacteriota bacterium]
MTRAGIPTLLKKKAASLPERPGCYLFRSPAGRILYVGKAKNLRRRVLSYFRPPAGQPPRVQAMVAEAAGLEVILTGTEVEALILENNLVKKNRPRFNVMLRDDKSFPYLKLTIKDRYPRVVLVRRPRLDGNLYYGPFTPASVARRTLKMVARFFQVATCYERFDGSRPRPCILHQMHRCLAPCMEWVDGPRYGQAVQDVRLFLEGRDLDLVRSLKKRMGEAAAEQDYERAAGYRDLLSSVQALTGSQAMASVGMEDQDYFGMHQEGGRAAVQVFEMRGGLMQSRREFFFEAVDDHAGRFLGEVVARYYAGSPLVPGRIFCASRPAEAALLEQWLGERRGRRVRIVAPRRGVHHRFLRTVEENARLAWSGRFAADHTLGVAVHASLRDLLGLKEAPACIEGFDISHVQGTDTVASVVVWEGGRPRRASYRRMRIRGAVPGDDYAAMAEAVGRRYRRLVETGKRLPDLVLIDGGRGQLSAAQAALEKLGIGTLPVIALAKKDEALYLPARAVPLILAPDDPIRHLVTAIRDEAHRFAVAYHRQRRRARTVATALTAVPGIGPRRARSLLRRFGSVAAVGEASLEDLAAVVGRGAARSLHASLASTPARKKVSPGVDGPSPR